MGLLTKNEIELGKTTWFDGNEEYVCELHNTDDKNTIPSLKIHFIKEVISGDLTYFNIDLEVKKDTEALLYEPTKLARECEVFSERIKLLSTRLEAEASKGIVFEFNALVLNKEMEYHSVLILINTVESLIKITRK